MEVKNLVKGIVKKLINPVSLFKLLRIQRQKKKRKSVFVDKDLQLLSQLAPGGFLHYPYFPDPDIDPEDISMSDIREGGTNYTNMLIKLIKDKKSPVLDVGCGMGGLSSLLLEKGYNAVGLTPDNLQYEHIRGNLPGLEVINSKFENMDRERYSRYFGTIINSESMQYINLERGIPVYESVLKPGGRWIVADYFKKKKKPLLRGGHNWEQFEKKITESGFRIVSSVDITPNILPLIKYMNMIMKNQLYPLVDYFIGRLRTKEPGIFFLLEEIIGKLKKYVTYNEKYLDAELFSEERKYMMLVIEKNPAS
ncbi:MAG TPA: class I SAM-dependent methyltransferase [Spirochaetes bacterium]|nr:class I SAM-dependent methyltransferase [Spirochaetota bacterium]